MRLAVKKNLIPFQDKQKSKNMIKAEMIFDFHENTLTAVYWSYIHNLLLVNNFNALANNEINKSQKYLRKDDLWKTTCFEFFLKNKSSNQYLEMNLSCNNEWNLYLFKNYRERENKEELELIEPNLITLSHLKTQDSNTGSNTGSKNEFKLEIQLPLQPLLKLIKAEHHWQFNLTAVTEYTDHTKEYWAIQHAQRQPDFHDFGSMLQFPDKT